ncbi:hypothetical protein PFISCL1PPCAC_28293, partial [Pristionchus fissidentatus]
ICFGVRMSIPPYTLVDEGSELLWTQFQNQVREMNWTSDDNIGLGLVPVLPTTRCVFAKKNEDGSFLGCVVWNEYDEMAFIGFYFVHPSLKKCGLGSKIWARAMERIHPTKRVIGLRAVPEMAPRYASKDTPVEISRLRKNVLTCSEMREFCGRYPTSSGTLVLVSQMTKEHKEDLLRFDAEITGRQRSDFLVRFLSSPISEGVALVNGEGKIYAFAGITTFGFAEDHFFKLAPVYASTLSEFATLTSALIPYCEKVSANSRIIVHILTGTVGERELEPVIGNPQHIECVTLFSSKIENKLNANVCYAPHNSGCHFDG